MILTKTPYRISFFGGGTDYHAWYQVHGGAVLSTSINHYCNILCSFKAPFFEKKHRIVWREIEEVDEIWQIKHPTVRAVMEQLDIRRGVNISHQGELPARSGLGSSSSFAVGLLYAIYTLQGQSCSKQELAAEAVHIERDILGEAVGVQDQIAAAYGGLNKIEVNTDGSFVANPLAIKEERSRELKNHLMLFFTGISRTASDIAKVQIANVPKKSVELHEMRNQVDIACDILVGNGDIRDFGRLLHEAWQLKRSLSGNITNSIIDEIYNKAKNAGAIGGKLLGAGGGGFMLFFVEPEKQSKILEALSDLLWIPFDFEDLGSHVALHSPTQFSRESLMRRDFAHLEHPNISNLREFIGESNVMNGDKKSTFAIID